MNEIRNNLLLLQQQQQQQFNKTDFNGSGFFLFHAAAIANATIAAHKKNNFAEDENNFYCQFISCCRMQNWLFIEVQTLYARCTLHIYKNTEHAHKKDDRYSYNLYLMHYTLFPSFYYQLTLRVQCACLHVEIV